MAACGVKAWMQDAVESLMVTMAMRDMEAGQGRWWGGRANSSPLTPVLVFAWLHLYLSEYALETGCFSLSLSLSLFRTLLAHKFTHTFLKEVEQCSGELDVEQTGSGQTRSLSSNTTFSLEREREREQKKTKCFFSVLSSQSFPPLFTRHYLLQHAEWVWYHKMPQDALEILLISQ